jgi:hypothetical protein
MSFSCRLIRNLLPWSLFALSTTVHAESKSTVVSDPRPLAKAVAQLEALCGFPVTYEDPPYVHDSEITDVTDKVQGARQNGKRVLIPKGGSFTFTFDLPAAGGYPGGGLRLSATAAEDVIASMLQSYAATRNENMFAVTRSDRLFHVVPTHFINRSGKPEPLTPLLSTELTVSPKSRTGVDLVSEICRSLSLATGQTVVVGNVPSSLLANHPTTITASNEPARAVLSRLLQEFDIPLSWQLFYDPGFRLYVLNIHSVTPANR